MIFFLCKAIDPAQPGMHLFSTKRTSRFQSKLEIDKLFSAQNKALFDTEQLITCDVYS